MDSVERELKLVPRDSALLDRLALVDRLGPFGVERRHHEIQHNSFFDTRDGALERERVGFRRRTVKGERLARWTIKGDAQHVGGVATRAEIELALDAFNVTNRVDYVTYVGDLASPFFGQAVAAKPPRRLQLSARFNF